MASDMEVEKRIGALLAERRKKTGLSYREMRKLMRIKASVSTLCRWEKGRISLKSVLAFASLCWVLGFTIPEAEKVYDEVAQARRRRRNQRSKAHGNRRK